MARGFPLTPGQLLGVAHDPECGAVREEERDPGPEAVVFSSARCASPAQPGLPRPDALVEWRRVLMGCPPVGSVLRSTCVGVEGR